MEMHFEIIEGQRFASRGREPDIIGILDSDGRTFMIQRGRDGVWSIPYSHIAAWHSDADQDYAAENYDADEVARSVNADSDLFGIAATSMDNGVSAGGQGADFDLPERSRGIALAFHPPLVTMKARRL
jgi:predicted NUDIX family NTP pyrophosphohydrolase